MKYTFYDVKMDTKMTSCNDKIIESHNFEIENNNGYHKDLTRVVTK